MKEVLHDIFLHRDHPGCSFWNDPGYTILVVYNPSVEDLVRQSTRVMTLGYKLSGGIQLIRRDNGDFNACATFLA